MPPQTRLGGFKILNEVVSISLEGPGGGPRIPAQFCRLLAEKRINLPFFNCSILDQCWGLDAVVDASQAAGTRELVQIHRIPTARCCGGPSAILSLFPHKSDPEIPGALLTLLCRQGVAPEALAQSNSAISMVLKERGVGRITEAFFSSFRFSAYRTPEDWNLVRKGSAPLYREVVASYQEKRPKVYCLEWQGGQEFIQLRVDTKGLCTVGNVFREFSRWGRAITFLTSRPSREEGTAHLLVCLPGSGDHEHLGLIRSVLPHSDAARKYPVAVFSMNGPHFGDRYGIAGELFTAFEDAGIEPLALSCSVATITGALQEAHMPAAIESIRKRFDVPSVINRPPRSS